MYRVKQNAMVMVLVQVVQILNAHVTMAGLLEIALNVILLISINLYIRLGTCPSAPSWFDYPIATDTAHQDAECSSMGHCNRETGECECAEGFEGGACERSISI